jgi:hypothetical protein
LTWVPDVYLELGKSRVFACAVDWPGWCRAGRDEQQALEALAGAATRYAVVAREAGVRFPASTATDFDVVERVPGSATTDFGAPGVVPALDLDPLKKAKAERLATLVEACWEVFDHIVAGAPAELRKGPRGGGRDRDKIVDHVLGAEIGYASKIGLRQRQPTFDDAGAVKAHRAAILEALRTAPRGKWAKGDRGWPPRYAARRIGWHAMDHAWEIEDRTDVEP